MTRYLYIIIPIVLFSCSANKDIVRIEDIENPTDSTEYIIFIDESGYDSWIVTNAKPMWYHEQPFYHSWNTIYTKEFNHKVRTSSFDHPFNEMIDYDQTIDYGIEVEYKLYWYFKFIEEKYNIKLNISSR
ncbi:MAG: DUF6146 family protein [Bacteroidales bacterium]|nr:DUF6146 family protein [Bacteroidales bacterium]